MSDLADLLEPRLEELIRRWTARIAETLAPGGLSEPELRDHTKDVLHELVAALRRDSVPPAMGRARQHGQQRYRLGFVLSNVVREYGVMRGLILDLSEEAGLALSMRDLRLLTDFFAVAIAESVDEYEAYRDHAEDVLNGEVREREVQLRTVLDSTAEGVWGVDQEGHCTFANRAAVRMLGVHTPDDLLGRDLLGAPHSRRGEAGDRDIASALTGVLQTGQEVRGDDVRMERPDGTTFPARYSISPLQREDQVSGAVVTFEDITERRRIEQERADLLAREQTARAEAESERKKQHDLFMQAPAAIAILDGPAHTFTFANPAYRALVGGRDVVGQAVLEALPEIRGQGFDTLLDQVMATGVPFLGNEISIQLDRTGTGRVEQAYLNFTYSPKHSASGETDGVLVSVVDVTSQVQSRHQVERLLAQLRQGEERLRLVVDTSGTGTWELNVVTRELVGDEHFRALFGLSLGEPFDLDKALALMPPEDHDRIAHLVADALAGKDEGRYRAEHRVLRPTGLSWMEARGRAILGPDGKAERFLGTGIDITDRKQIEQEREHLVAELTRSNAALDQFAHVASHDLKAPLRGIANLAEWIEDDLGDAITPDARDKLGLMRGRTRHLEKMISGILDFATAGRNQASPESVDPRRLLTDVVGLLSPPESLTLTIGEPMPTLVVERVALQQVFMNLLGNAIKYVQRPDAVIRVEGKDEDAFVHFTIADNGPGIAPKDHERIWGLFQKASAPSKVEGTGIGLAVVKKMVESRGGRVWVESELGRGATFHVVWPRRPLRETSGVRGPSSSPS